MRVTLNVRTGPLAGRTFELGTGQAGRVGRGGAADLAVPGDPFLAELHFLLECGPGSCRVRDLDTDWGTLVNGARVREAVLRDGDWIYAGQTTFAVHLAEGGPALAGPGRSGPTSGAAERLLSLLTGRAQPLFGLLDAARDPTILARLRGSGEAYESLYDGEKGEELAEFAPYLVSLPAESPLLAALVREGWGRSWGVYLTSDAPFKEVRKHFRHFLLVKLEDGRDVYFRFYDPRVLRVFLPTCTPQEASEFFGPVGSYSTESGGAGELWTFTKGPRGAERGSVPLSG